MAKWIKHTGSMMPVDGSTIVRVLTKSGKEWSAELDAATFGRSVDWWAGKGFEGGIDWYQIVEQKEEPKVTKFKVGDRVRSVSDETYGIRIGGEYIVDLCDCRSVHFVDDDGDDRMRMADLYELAEPADTELATLRAFREAAIARYPDLAEPESDVDAAKRFKAMYYSEDPEDWQGVMDAAFAWARANPR